ncbi:hypothetical protein [Cohnella yongneupensis]|uniref:RCC1-like domain-containing protein n=1 Tax=Cohnella yongneupensis TaxID=425006 RepID=A0ABW0QYB7_9BACL
MRTTMGSYLRTVLTVAMIVVLTVAMPISVFADGANGASPKLTEKWKSINLYGYPLAIQTDGSVWTWGEEEGKEPTPPTKLLHIDGAEQIVRGIDSIILLKQDGTVWKSDGWRTPDNIAEMVEQTFTRVDGLTDIAKLAGEDVALKRDGTVWVWGNFGSTYSNIVSDYYTPAKIQELSDIVDLAKGSNNVLALKKDGTVWAWGRNTYGQLGDGTISSLDSSLMNITKNHDRKTPAQVLGLPPIKQVASNTYGSYALDVNGNVWKWGSDSYNAPDEHLTPFKVEGLNGVTAVAAGEDHVAALKNDGTVWTWGNNDYGQLGDGTQNHYNTGNGFVKDRDRIEPQQVQGIGRVTSLQVTGNTNVVFTADDQIMSWGINRLSPAPLTELTSGPFDAGNIDLSGFIVEGANLEPAYSAVINDYKLTATGKTFTIKSTAVNPNASIAVDGKPLQGDSMSIPTAGANLHPIEITVTSSDGQHKRSFTLNVQSGTVAVKGKMIVVNGRLLGSTEEAVTKDGVLYIPAPSLLAALDLNGKASLVAGSQQALLNGETVQLPAAPQLIGSKLMVPLKSVQALTGATTSTVVYGEPVTRTVSDSEKKLTTAYQNAASEYKKQAAAYDKAKSAVNSVMATVPAFYVFGEIKEDDPHDVWGYTYPVNVSGVSAPGFLTKSSNIVIKNPDKSKLAFGQYVGGVHYYLGKTTGKGLFGQTVPIYIFGPPPANIASKLNGVNGKLTAAKKQLDKATTSLSTSKNNLLKGVRGEYDKLIKKSPSAGTYLQYAMALVDAATLLNDSNLLKEAKGKVDKAVKYNEYADIFYAVYASRHIDREDRINGYATLADSDPYLLLSALTTAEQYYDVGVLFSQNEDSKDLATYALTKAAKTGNADIKKKAEAQLQKIGK